MRGIRRVARIVLDRVNKDISGYANSGGMYAKGLAGEGYDGGYAQAIQDILLWQVGGEPNTRQWWNFEEEGVS